MSNVQNDYTVDDYIRRNPVSGRIEMRNSRYVNWMTHGNPKMLPEVSKKLSELLSEGYKVEPKRFPKNWPPESGDVWEVNGQQLFVIVTSGANLGTYDSTGYWNQFRNELDVVANWKLLYRKDLTGICPAPGHHIRNSAGQI